LQVSSTPPQTRDLSIADLRGEVRGKVTGPESTSYDEARQVFFKGFDRRPLAIVQAAGADDVARVVSGCARAGSSLPFEAALTAAGVTGPPTAAS
jgi:hypothetical protein